ncbi:MAG: FHA domain-containing protein [Phycisphaeraceae bacterium]|nr:FHA domain-containing protein [Phycisphaerales bacterium]MCB9859963.1 FHA domain-containing protein [Phycisphaeraceae bacterium]
MLLLTVLEGPDRGRRFELPDDEPQLIGRSSEALPLSDSTVSRRHAELTPDNGDWWVRDLKSQNGTQINGVRVDVRTKLRAGDHIRCGSTLMLFGKEDTDERNFIKLLKQSQMDSTIESTLSSTPRSGMSLAMPVSSERAAEHLRIIYTLTQQTSASLDQKELLGKAMDLIFAEFRPERGFILLGGVVPEEGLKPTIVRFAIPTLENAKEQEDISIRVSRTILQHAVRTGQGVLSTNAMRDPRFSAGDSVRKLGIQSAICSPIVHGRRTFGAIYIDRSIATTPFTEEQLALLNALGQHIGLAMETAQLLNETLQSERLVAIGNTVASLSHSIKNILQGLRGGADVVGMGLEKNNIGVARDGWDILKRNLDRIVGLTMNMLAFSRERSIEPELAQVGPIVEECVQLLELQCASFDIALMTDIEQEIPPIPIDRSLIHQAVMNLVTNAVEAVRSHDALEGTQKSVTVSVSYHPAGSRGENAPAVVQITVIDTGPGIPTDRQQRVFLPFQTTKGTKGTGLGLAVTRRIVEEHRGVLRLESAPGKGAAFHILLPADPDTAIDPSATTIAQQSAFGFGIDPPF